MTHKTNCYAYVITAINRETGMLQGYYDCDIAHVSWRATITYSPSLTGCIWNAKFFQAIKSARKALNFCKEKSPKYDWKIQEVSMNAPQDIDD